MKIIFNEEENEAQAFDKDRKVGICQFVKEDGAWNILHTIVKRPYQGQGLAEKLLDTVVDEARKNEVKIIPTCSYVSRSFNENPEKYGDVAL